MKGWLLRPIRLNAIELLVATALAIAAIVALAVAGLGAEPARTTAWGCRQGADASLACASAARRLDAAATGAWIAFAAAAAVPAAGAVLLGAPLVAREIEHRTAPFVFALAARRERWFIDAWLPLLALLVTLTAVLAVVSDVVAGGLVQVPGIPTFSWAGERGLLLIGRGLVFFAVTCLASAALGRSFVAGLTGAGGSLLLMVGIDQVKQVWARSVQVPLSSAEGKFGLIMGASPAGDFGLPGSRYQDWVNLDLGLSLGIFVVATIATVAVVHQRHPS